MIGKKILKKIYRKYKESLYRNQGKVSREFFGFNFEFPENHSLLAILDKDSGAYEALRENGLIQLIKAMTVTGKRGTVIDIGANICDTAAIVASLSDYEIVCVEASSFFFNYLRKNVGSSSFAARTRLFEGFVVNHMETTPKKLIHWGGTASEGHEPLNDESVNIYTIENLVKNENNVVLMKTDIDGGDIKILGNSIPILAEKNIPIYFELELPWMDEVAFLKEVEQFFSKLKMNGYKYLFFWDNGGHFLNYFTFDTNNALTCMLNYLHLNKMYRPRYISNYDIACIHGNDSMLAIGLIDEINKQTHFQMGENDDKE